MQEEQKIECAELWLRLAIDLHVIHLKYPDSVTPASQEEMMDYMANAYKCISDKPIIMNAVGLIGDH